MEGGKDAKALKQLISGIGRGTHFSAVFGTLER